MHTNTMKMAVVGKDVSKSLSPQMHRFIMNKMGVEITYDTISVPETEFERRITTLLQEYDGLNVTIPYKLSVMPHLREIKEDAAVFGAVNVVDVKKKRGYNTDGMGFLLMLQNADVQVFNKRILVLGSGGVGRSVIKKMLDAGAEVFAYDLNQEGLKKVKEEFPDFTPLARLGDKPYDIILNCTGVGMHKTEGISPVGEELLALCEVAVDLIYAPEKSEFLRIAERLGKKIVNGESMLFYQAYYGDCILLDKEPDAKTAKALFEEYKTITK